MAKLKEEKEVIEELSDNSGSLGYKPTPENEEIRKMVYERYNDMKAAEERSEAEKDWDEGDKAYRAYTEEQDDDDYRTNINKPIAFSIIETELQETIERKSRPQVEPRESSDTAGAEFTNDTLNYSFDIGNFDYQLYLAKKEAYIRGTSFILDYYKEDKRVVKDMELVKNENGELVENYKEIEKIDFDDCYAEYIPCEMVYLDPAANHISKCRDAIIREVLNVDEFHRKYSHKRGITDLEYVLAGGDTNYYTYYAPPQDKNQGEEVEVLHYYNRSLDIYAIVANDVVIKNTPIPYKHKEIPIVVIYCYKVPNKLYGYSISKIIQSLVDERNTISNLRLDSRKLSLQKMYFYDDMIELDDIDLVSRPHGGIPVNTQGRPLRDVLTWIDYNNVNMGDFREEEVLIEDIRRSIGVDDRVQGVNMGGTATEAAILKEASMKRINAKMILMEMDSLTRLGFLRLSNISQFYSVPKIERIVKENGEINTKKNYRSIKIKGKEYKFDENGNLAIEEIPGFSFVKMNDKRIQKVLNAQYDIIIKPDASTQLSKPLQQAKTNEMFDRFASNPLLMQELDIRKTIERVLEINNEDKDNWLKRKKNEDVDMRAHAEVENQVMSSGYPLPPTPEAEEDHTYVHIAYTKSSAFEQLNPKLQAIFEAHINGEAERMGVGTQQPNMASQLPKPNINPIDIMPNRGMTQREEGGI